ncbi:hypothetical protein M758_8G136100 [Ceratodon purpureus]|nr:hypothetical protein M758_8G136100 [Ceratodon purpureus]
MLIFGLDQLMLYTSSNALLMLLLIRLTIDQGCGTTSCVCQNC